MKRYFPLTLLLALVVGFSACKKEVVNPTPVDPRPVFLDDEHENKVRDSIWYYYKVLSLWESYVPPRTSNINDIEKKGYIRENYTKFFETGEDVLDHLMELTKTTASQSSMNYDWYSFLDRAGVVSGELQEGVATSYGMYVFYLQTASSGDNADLYVRMVDKNSPAYLAGIRRGDKIVSIDGNSNIDYNAQKTLNFGPINQYLQSSNMKIRFVKPSSSSVIEKDLVNRQYNMDPVLDNRVIDVGTKKVGYLAFSSFVNVLQSSNGMKATFDAVFADFENKGVNELIVDLRYNGGGAVVTAEYLADRIAPASVDKQLMYQYEVNDLIESWGWLDEGDEFGPVYFNRQGGLNLSRVYFLVTSSTASASELLINTLMPHMDVFMVGTYAVNDQDETVAENTYGKPVGFFGLPIVDDDIELYVTSFKTSNSRGEGNYFTGLKPNGHVWEFSNFRDFGDRQEPMIASALNHIENGNFGNASSRVAMSSTGRVQTNRTKRVSNLQENRLNNGMYKLYKKDLKK